MPNRGDMMKKLQEMQENMEKVQAEIEERDFTASAGGGAVEVTVSGKHEIRSIKIKPEVVDPEEVDMLEDLLTASLNEAIRKASETMDREMGGLTGDMPSIPGLPSLF